MKCHQPAVLEHAGAMARILAIVLATAITAAITACATEQPPPTHHPQTEGLRLIQTIEPIETETTALQTVAAMRSEINALQTKAAEPEGARRTEQPKSTTATVTTVAPVTSTPEPTATLPPPPRYSPSDNICRRSPGVQNALINKLQMSSCRIITVDELFRLDSEFSASFNESPRRGDFAGMTNLRRLTISLNIPEGEQGVIPDQLLHGLAKLETLTLELRGRLTVSPNAVHNLPKLKSITVRSSGNLSLERDFVSGVPKLMEIEIQFGPNSHLKEHALNNLDRITELTVRWDGSSNDTPSRNTVGQFGYLNKLKTLEIQHGPSIPPHIFQNLPELQEIQVSTRHLRMSEDTFSNNPRLERVEINGPTSGHKTAFSSLEKLEHLRMSNSYSSERKPEIILSPKSPLMKAILNGQKSPDGYIVIPPGGE